MKTQAASPPPQSEKLIVLPPTHEQSNPSFHVEARLAKQLLAFLERRGIRAWRPPERLEKPGPDGQPLVEIEVEASASALEKLAGEFEESRR